MTFTEFCERILIVLYQDGHSSDEWLSLAALQAKYGLEVDPSWLSRAMNHLKAQRRVDGKEISGQPATVVAKITGSGMAHIEEKFGSKDGVGTIIPPISPIGSFIVLDSEGQSHQIPVTGVQSFALTDSVGGRGGSEAWPSESSINIGDIPASDRIVKLDHNSPEFVQVKDGIDSLIQVAQKWNGNPDNPDERDRIICALNSAKELWGSFELKVVQIKVGIIMAIQDAQRIVGGTTRNVSAAILIDIVKGIVKNCAGIDLDNQ